MTCKVCNAPFSPGRKFIFCSERCRRTHETAKERAKYQAMRVAKGPRHCLDCNIALEGYASNAVRCHIHRRERKLLQTRIKTAESRAKAKAVAPKSSGPRRITSENIADHLKVGKLTPSADSPPWFEGWNGCYSPTLTKIQIELIESEKGRVVLDPKQQTMVVIGRDNVRTRKAG